MSTSDQDRRAVVRLPETPKPPPPRPTGPGRLHSIGMAGMAVSAVTGSLGTLAFITVTWPGKLGHWVLVAIFLSAVVFLASASIAVIAAARDTYPRRPSGGGAGKGPE